MPDPSGDSGASDIGTTFEDMRTKSDALTTSANAFAKAIALAFAQAATSGKQFDDVLKSLVLRLSDQTVTKAFSGLANNLAKGLSGLLTGNSDGAQTGSISAFASGGVINTPSYFPLASGGLGLAGEAGPEAIMPLARGPDGRLGIAGGGGGQGGNITVQIATPDAASFQKSEAYITGQIARAVARGQRGL
ncbi:MAG: phage tail tape measure protein [Rhodopseudomonas sp.]|nr:phage tail tape measure protein [Rhodopseudomonas sp.]